MMNRIARYIFLIVTLLLSSPLTSAQDELPTDLHPIYDAENLKPLMRFGYGWANDIAWSPDGATLAVATSIGVWLYDVSDLQADPVLVNETVFRAQVLAYSPDGRFLAAGGSEVHVWDTDTHELVRSLDASKSVIGLAFSPDHTQLVISHGFAATTFGVEIWNIETGHQIKILSEGVFSNLVFSPDGSHIAGIRLADCCFRTYLWDALTGEILFRGDIEVRADDERILFSPDHEMLVAVDRTGSFSVLDAQAQTILTTVTLDTESEEWYPAEVSFTPDGKSLIALSRLGILRIWDTENFTSIATVELNWNPYKAHLSPDGSQIAAIDRIGNLRIWEIATGQVTVQRTHFAVDDPVITFSPDGALLASGAAGGEIWLWDIVTGNPVSVLSGHEDTILALDFSSDGTLLVSASEDGTVRLWSVEDHVLLSVIVENNHKINTIIVDSQNQLLIAEDTLISIYDLMTGEPLAWFGESETNTFPNQITIRSGIDAIAFEGNRLAVATLGQVQYWDHNGAWIVNNGLDWLSINVLAFFNEDTILYAGDNHVVLEWDIGQDTNVLLTPHNSWIYALASTYQVIVSAGCAETKRSPWDGSPYCDGADLRLSVTLPAFLDFTIISQEQGHTETIRAVIFNPAETLLATVSDDGTILLWGNSTFD